MKEIAETFALAHNYYNSGDFDSAFSLYEHLSMIDPGNYMLLYEMGLVLVRMHEFELAEEYFARAAMDSPCSYRMSVSGRCLYSEEERTDTELCVYPSLSEMLRVDEYLAQGYMCYANYYRLKACPDCSRCQPYRVSVKDFVWSKKVMRTVKKNKDLRVSVLEGGGISAEKIELYKSYMKARHNEDSPSDAERALAQRHYGFKNTLEMDYYLGDRLVAVGLCVTGRTSMYSGFFYHDPVIQKQRPGFYSMYMEIAFALRQGFEWYYPGWYVAGISNMEYKKELAPAQVMVNGGWIDFHREPDSSGKHTRD